MAVCTPEETFSIRQVQSSNVLNILRVGGDASVSIIARCHGSLELSTSHLTADHFMRQLLPTYTGTNASGSHLVPVTKDSMYEDVPCSHLELDQAWRRLCAFEWLDRAWLPNPSALLECWKSFRSFSLAHDVDITATFAFSIVQSSIEDEGQNSALLKALLQRLSVTADHDFDGQCSVNHFSLRMLIRRSMHARGAAVCARAWFNIA